MQSIRKLEQVKRHANVAQPLPSFGGAKLNRPSCADWRQWRLISLAIVLFDLRRLQSLNVSNCVSLHGDDLCSCLTSHSLVSLELWRVPHTTARALFGLASAKSAATLQELDVGWCSAVDAATGCVVAIAKACHALKKVIRTSIKRYSSFFA